MAKAKKPNDLTLDNEDAPGTARIKEPATSAAVRTQQLKRKGDRKRAGSDEKGYQKRIDRFTKRMESHRKWLDREQKKEAEKDEKKWRRATDTAAKKIAALFVGSETMTPEERLAAYLAAGREIQRVRECELTYGPNRMAELASRVPELGNVGRAAWLAWFSYCNDELWPYFAAAVAAPMGNGRPLLLGHWMWAVRACSPNGERLDFERFEAELAWLRREAPSEEVLEHIVGVLDDERWRAEEEERDELRKQLEGVMALC